MVQRNLEWRRVTSYRRRPEPPRFLLPGLRDHQSLALGALSEAGGLSPSRGSLIQLNIGEGKTLVSFLAARVLGAKAPLVVVMASIKHQTLADIERYRAMGFDFPTPRVCSYRELSSKNWAQRLTPDIDLVICDEAQKLKNTQAGVTTRIVEHCRSRPARLVVLSANIVTDSIMNIWHLADVGLGDESPLPRLAADAASWAGALDAGVLPQNRVSAKEFLDWPGSDFEGTVLARARAAWIRRVAETRGVYIQPPAPNPLPLVIGEFPIKVPGKAAGMLDEMRATWTRPDGHQLLLASEYTMAAKTLAYGYFHYWAEYPGEWWYDARKRFAGFIGSCKTRHGASMATDGDVIRAYPNAEPVLAWRAAQAQWQPTPKVEWVDDGACREVAAWVAESPGRIAWYRYPALGEMLAKHAHRSVGFYPAGSAHGKKLVAGRGAAIASWPSHGTGLNLQRFWEAVTLESPVGADKVNQMIGRLRRYGQTETVQWWFPLHTPEIENAWMKTIERAEQLALMNQNQAVLDAEWRL